MGSIPDMLDELATREDEDRAIRAMWNEDAYEIIPPTIILNDDNCPSALENQ